MRRTQIGIVLVLIVAMTGIVYAAADKDKKSETTIKAVKSDKTEGAITAIGPNYMSVSSGHDTAKGIEYEMRLPVETGVVFTNKKNLKELKVGDTVEVAYDDLTEETASGEKATRKLKSVTFVSPAPSDAALTSGEGAQ